MQLDAKIRMAQTTSIVENFRLGYALRLLHLNGTVLLPRYYVRSIGTCWHLVRELLWPTQGTLAGEMKPEFAAMLIEICSPLLGGLLHMFSTA